MDTQVLKKCPLFAGLDDDQLKSVEGSAVQKKYPKSKVIFAEGQRAEGFYVLLSGKVKIYKISASGKEQILHILGPSEPFAEVALFEGASYPAFAEALVSSRVFYFPKTEFLKLLKKDPQLSLNMLATMAKFLKRFSRMIERLSLKDVSARLAQYLIHVMPHESGEQPQIKLKQTKTQLASQLGTVSETLSRTLKKFKEEGIVEVKGKCITILDQQALREIGGLDDYND